MSRNTSVNHRPHASLTFLDSCIHHGTWLPANKSGLGLLCWPCGNFLPGCLLSLNNPVLLIENCLTSFPEVADLFDHGKCNAGVQRGSFRHPG